MGHSVTPRYSEFDQLLPPWNMNILKDYLFKAQCFVSQYTSYYDKEADLHVINQFNSITLNKYFVNFSPFKKLA